MARPLIFTYEKKELPCQINKVDRSKLYGSVKQEAVDDDGNPCRLVTMGSDGKTLIPMGGTAFAYIGSDGRWCDKDSLTPVDLEGEEIEPVKSSFSAPIPLKQKVDVTEYLSHNIRLVYQLDPEEDMPDKLLKELKDGTIYQFPFSYRGGLEADAGFMLTDPEGAIWMCVGKPTRIQFVGFEQSGGVPEVDEEEEEDAVGDLMDFGNL